MSLDVYALQFGGDSVPYSIILRNVWCSGSETSLLDCIAWSKDYNIRYCDLSKISGVRCLNGMIILIIIILLIL